MAFSRRVGRVVFAVAALGGVLALNACVVQPSYEQLDAVTPIGSDFSKALFKDYAYIARSFGNAAATAGTTFDADSSIPVTDYDADVTDLANAFADKAIVAGRGEEVVIEPVSEDDNAAQLLRLRVLKDIDAGRDKEPALTARMQTDFDCWVMNGRVDSQKEASVACRHALDNDIAALESKVGAAASDTAPPAGAPAPDNSATPDNSSAAPAPDNSAAPATAPATAPVTQAPAPPVTAAPAPAASSAPPPAAAPSGPQYTLYFAVGSAALTSDDVMVIQHAMDDARQSGAGHIVIVGHADASEPHAQALSDARADAARNLMMQMGARYESIQVSGTGDKDLAVRAGRGVKEPRNRRAIITLTP
jgi:outer membrane protein OmpA-like peptidoglycan-associated protein